MPSATRRTVQLGTLELAELPVTALPAHPADAAEVLTMRIPATGRACRATSIADRHATSRRPEVRCTSWPLPRSSTCTWPVLIDNAAPKSAMTSRLMTKPKMQIVSCVSFQASTNLCLGARTRNVAQRRQHAAPRRTETGCLSLQTRLPGPFRNL